MRTTVNITDGLLEAAKQRARQRGVPLGTVIDDALRRDLSRDGVAGRTPSLDLPASRHAGGPLPGVDLTSNRAVQEQLDEGLPLEKLR